MANESTAFAMATETPAPLSPLLVRQIITVVISKLTATFSTGDSSISPLFQLPPELRNNIYNYVLGGNVYHLYMPDNSVQPRSISYTSHTTQATRPLPTVSLLRVNRQAHDEASLLLYANNTFSFAGVAELEAFTKHCTPAQLGAITKLELWIWGGRYLLGETVSLGAHQFSALAGMRNLETIDVCDFYGNLRLPTEVDDNLVELARFIRVTKPGLRITAQQEDREGRWVTSSVDL